MQLYGLVSPNLNGIWPRNEALVKVCWCESGLCFNVGGSCKCEVHCIYR